MNSYDPCKQHINGHTPQCLICEIEVLRSEVHRLREENDRLRGAEATLDKAIEMINGLTNKEG